MGETRPIREITAAIAELEPDEQARIIGALSDAQREVWRRWWDCWASEGQRDPPGDPAVWLILAGRGFGKTRAGAEWLSEQARMRPGGRFALVGATIDDVERVMVRGPSGLVAVADGGARWLASAGELRFASGARAFAYAASAAEGLRGPEHHAAWCDELGKWRGEDAWHNLLMGLRLGERPRVLVTTTPRATPLVRRVKAAAEARGAVVYGRTRDNPHLPDSFVAAMEAEYGGTRLGRQELDGELIEEAEGALWSRAMIERNRVKRRRATLVRVVVGVDPPAGIGGDACGIVAVGLGADGLGYVLADASVTGASPEGWARAVARCAERVEADRIVAEKNQGGEMVRSVLAAADARMPIRLVHASRGKSARAEPVATLYERDRVRHVGGFPALEDEMCGLVAGGGYDGPGRSPDRADALVWALTELMLGGGGRVGVRRL